MIAFRVLLLSILVSLTVYTVIVVSNHGFSLLPVFLGDIAEMAWPGQFNFDFMCFLSLSATWVAWRNRFSAAGVMLGVLAFFCGALFLSIYLLILSFQESASIEKVLLGQRA